MGKPKYPIVPSEQFNCWTVICEVKSLTKNRKALCRCKCGQVKEVIFRSIREGTSKSCGCYCIELATKHGHASDGHLTEIYMVWSSMIRRCNDLNNKTYGGRGIKVCERWLDFNNFYSDMGDRPSEKHSLDRYPNNNGDYEPSNCRWATRIEQSRNRRSNRLIEFQGETKCLKEWAEQMNINRSTIIQRINKGESIEESLTKPASQIRKRKS